MHRCRIPLVLVLLALTACSGMLQKGSLIRVRNAYAAADYEECVIRTESARTNFDEDIPPAADAELLFYKGLCLDKAERSAEAVTFFERVVSKYPDTDWGIQSAARLKASKAAK